MNNYIGIALDELCRIFEALNARYFKGELPSPVITIQSAKKPNVLGWFTLDKLWSSKDKSDTKYEINISAEYLDREVGDIVETLQHEIIHYYNKLSDIVDYHGKYHTKKFKNAAEKFGLVCHKDSKIGYGLTERTDKFNEVIRMINPDPDAFLYFRTFTLKKKDVADRKKIMYKYTCENCGTEAKAKKDTSLICGTCNESMIMEDE